MQKKKKRYIWEENASPNWNNMEKGGCCEWEILKWYCVFNEAGSETDQMRRVRERSWKDDSLGSPLSWVARCEGRCCQEGLPKRWEGNHRPMQENFGRERIIPQSHMLWGSVVKGGLKMPLAFTSKEVIRDPGKKQLLRWGEVGRNLISVVNVDKSDYRCLFDRLWVGIHKRVSQRAAVVEKSVLIFSLKKKKKVYGGV